MYGLSLCSAAADDYGLYTASWLVITFTLWSSIVKIFLKCSVLHFTGQVSHVTHAWSGNCSTL